MLEKEEMEHFFNELTRKSLVVEKQLSQYPEGQLKVRRQRYKGKEYTFFYVELPQMPGEVRRQRKNITKDEELVRIMARKEYLRTALERMNGNIDILHEAISCIEDTSTEGILSGLDPAIQKEIVFQKQKEFLLPDDPAAVEALLEWVKAPYPKNPNYPQFLKHRTSTGELVRTKSEALVYEKLKEYKLAYRYENQLMAGDIAIYPDFTIRRTDGKIFYWEHAGRCDLQRYRDDLIWKIRAYESIGIGQWDNLIISFDVEDGRIDMREVESQIRNKLII